MLKKEFNMLEKFKQPILCIKLISIVICIVGLIRAFAVIAPVSMIANLIHIEGSNIFAELAKSLNLYLDGVQKTLNVESRIEVLYMFSFSFLISIFFVISGAFLFLMKSWARKMLLFLVILAILNPFVMMLLIGKLAIKFEEIENLIFYIFNLIFHIALLIFFTRRSIVQILTKGPESKCR